MTATPDEYRTIREKVRTESKVQGSKFIGTAIPISTKEHAEDCIAGLRKQFHDATHSCYAYRIGLDGNQFRFNDDGEPAGTAGKPILAAIDKLAFTDVCVVVTRYFGGTKLGVGGLIRAYGDAARQALGSAEVLTKYLLETLHVTFPHSRISDVMHVTSRLGARIVDTTYDEEVHLILEIRKSKTIELQLQLVSHTSGNVAIKVVP